MSAIYVPARLSDLTDANGFSGQVALDRRPAYGYEGFVPVASRCQGPNNSGQVNGGSGSAQTLATYRTLHPVPYDCSDLRIMYVNRYEETAPNADIQAIKCTIEYNGAFFTMWFNGARSIAMQSGSMAVTLPCGQFFPAGAQLWIRTTLLFGATGLVWPYSEQLNLSLGEGMVFGSDLCDGGTVTASSNFGFMPCSILGHTKQPGASKGVGVGGDSIAQGQASNPSGSNFHLGFIGIALQNNVPWSKCTEGGDVIWDSTINIQSRGFILKQYPNRVLNALTNNISGLATLASLKTSMLSACTNFGFDGAQVFYCTPTPKGYSSDAYATVANQVPYGCPISAIADNGSGLVRLTLGAPNLTVVATGNQFALAGMGTYLNATWTVTSIDSTHVDLQGSVFASAAAYGGTGGTAANITMGVLRQGIVAWMNDTTSNGLVAQAAALTPSIRVGVINSGQVLEVDSAGSAVVPHADGTVLTGSQGGRWKTSGGGPYTSDGTHPFLSTGAVQMAAAFDITRLVTA